MLGSRAFTHTKGWRYRARVKRAERRINKRRENREWQGLR